jgi:two-component system OmpR family sensor kinase/two-component system sensor histidine kinase BaeS
VHRIALVLALVLVLSSIGVATLVSLALGRASTILAGASTTGVAVAAAAIVGGLVLAFLAAMRRLGLPMGDVVSAADRVAAGDYSARVAERGPPFLRAVARAFNSMTTRLQEQDRQRRDLMADIAHELRTPLSVVQGRIEGLLDGVYPRDDARLGEVLEETRLLARLVEDLGTLAHSERGTPGLQKEPTDLLVLFGDAARSLASEAAARGVTVRVEDATDLPLVDVDPLRIREVLTNLIANAIRHSSRGAQVAIGTERRPGHILVRVHDDGPGIAADELPRIFDRFHKGERSHGSGLGLSIARNLVVAHGGEIAVASEVGRGTAVTFTLPAQPLG